MKVLSLSEVKTNLGRVIDEIVTQNKEVTITKKGRSAAVLMSLDEYDSLKETLYIKSNPDFMDEIKRGADSLKKISVYIPYRNYLKNKYVRKNSEYQMKRFNSRTASRFKAKDTLALSEITNDPAIGKPLQDELEGYRSFKVGKIRIVYQEPPSQIIESSQSDLVKLSMMKL